MINSEQKYVLITGANDGIGLGFVKYFLGLGWTVYAFSRSSNNLELLKKQNEKSLLYFCMDLSDEKNFQNIIETVKNKQIDMVINNVGVGVYGEFVNTNWEQHQRLINLNISLLTMLTNYFVKYFTQNKNGGRVINIGTISANVPCPYLSSYYASKIYVRSLSNAVNWELKKSKSSVRVLCINPGVVDTNFFTSSSGKKTNKKSGIPVDKFIELCGKKIFTSNKDNIFIGTKENILHFFSLFICVKLQEKILAKFQLKRLQNK